MEKAEKIGVVVYLSEMFQRHSSYKMKHVSWECHVMTMAHMIRKAAPVYVTCDCLDTGYCDWIDMSLVGSCRCFRDACDVSYEVVVDQGLDTIVVWNSDYSLISVDTFHSGIRAVEDGGCAHSARCVEDGWEVLDAVHVCSSKNEYAPSPHFFIPPMQALEVQSLHDLKLSSLLLGEV